MKKFVKVAFVAVAAALAVGFTRASAVMQTAIVTNVRRTEALNRMEKMFREMDMRELSRSFDLLYSMKEDVEQDLDLFGTGGVPDFAPYEQKFLVGMLGPMSVQINLLGDRMIDRMKELVSKPVMA